MCRLDTVYMSFNLRWSCMLLPVPSTQGSMRLMHQPLALRLVQVEEDTEYLQGSMRFMGSLFREHHLPHALIRTLVIDLTSHSEKVRRP